MAEAEVGGKQGFNGDRDLVETGVEGEP